MEVLQPPASPPQAQGRAVLEAVHSKGLQSGVDTFHTTAEGLGCDQLIVSDCKNS